MVGSLSQFSYDVDSFKLGATILRDPINTKSSATSFSEVLETQTKEINQQVEEKASQLVSDKKVEKKKKKGPGDLLDAAKIIENKKDSHQQIVGTKNTYKLLEEYKNKKSKDEDPFQKSKEQALNPNVAGQPIIQPDSQGQGKKYNRAQMLSVWERLAPTVTEDATKKSVRLDIPLLNDVKAIVLRMHSDRSITASVLGSDMMTDLIQKNKAKFDKNIRHHGLTLREFNTYRSELEFNSESGTKKNKKKKQSLAQNKKQDVGIL